MNSWRSHWDTTADRGQCLCPSHSQGIDVRTYCYNVCESPSTLEAALPALSWALACERGQAARCVSGQDGGRGACWWESSKRSFEQFGLGFCHAARRPGGQPASQPHSSSQKGQTHRGLMFIFFQTLKHDKAAWFFNFYLRIKVFAPIFKVRRHCIIFTQDSGVISITGHESVSLRQDIFFLPNSFFFFLSPYARRSSSGGGFNSPLP